MTITRKEVEHVARLARLALSEQEKALFEVQLGSILEHAQRVTSLDTEDIPPTSHAIPLSNVFRSDEVGIPTPRLTQDEALAQAPEAEEGHFQVPRILEAD